MAPECSSVAGQLPTVRQSTQARPQPFVGKRFEMPLQAAGGEIPFVILWVFT
jgi:hypothetical protein